MQKENRRGFIILEAILAIVVFAMVVFSVIPMIGFLLRRTAKSRYEARAAVLMQEAMESSYNIFISNWSAYPIDGIYHPGKSANQKWVLFSGAQTNLETIFSRSISIKKACRTKGNGELIPNQNAPCVGILDPNSRIITTTISWEEEGQNKQVKSELLLVNLEN